MATFKQGKEIRYDRRGNPIMDYSDIQGQTELFINEETGIISSQKEDIIDLEQNELLDFEEQELEENVLELIKPGKFDIRNFMDQFENKSELALDKLLSMQSNENPLKKGGAGIAFRCDAIILANKQTFNAKENTLFDIISGYVSSMPDETSYIIYAKDVQERLPYAAQSYVYTLMSEAVETLSNKPLLYDIELPNGDIQRVKVPWFTVLSYNKKSASNDASFVAFKPTPLFKMLMLAATITHGAYYQIEAASKIKSGYAKALYYILESRKDYREYKGATPGEFKFSLDELQVLIGYPSTYTTGEIKRSILDPAYKQINGLSDEIDFTFTYELIKTSKGGNKKQYTHVRFKVDKLLDVSVSNQVEAPNPDEVAVFAILKGQGLDERQCKDVFKKYVSNKRDLGFLGQAIGIVASYSDATMKTGGLCKIMDGGLEVAAHQTSTKAAQGNNNFHNFNQRVYSENELEIIAYLKNGTAVLDTEENREIAEHHNIDYVIENGKIKPI